MTSDSQLMDSRDVDSTEENENAKEDVAEQWEKGYDLPIDEPERKEAEDECKMILELISDIYFTPVAVLSRKFLFSRKTL